MTTPSKELLIWQSTFLYISERLAQKMTLASKTRSDEDLKVLNAIRTEFAATYRQKPEH